MKTTYEIISKDNQYFVYEVVTIFGKRIHAYESEQDTTRKVVFIGTVSDCESYIRLKESGLM